MGETHLLRDVSDTARWVAHYRALEAERPRSIVVDPFARRLAGERGEAIAADQAAPVYLRDKVAQTKAERGII
jgi:O-methyltransferase involved in polyketide biosynthesis